MSKKPKPTPNQSGVSFNVGRDLTQAKPVLLQLKAPLLAQPIQCWWTIEDAQLLAYALLKHAEICRRWKAERNQMATTPGPKPDEH